MELDEQRLDEVQQRIDTLDKIKRKYGNTLEDVLNNYEKFCAEYNSIEFSQDEINSLEEQKARTFYTNAGWRKRPVTIQKRNITRFVRKIRTELEKLDMPKVQFEINIQECDFGPSGFDNVEFLISTNISETPKPLAKNCIRR